MSPEGFVGIAEPSLRDLDGQLKEKEYRGRPELDAARHCVKSSIFSATIPGSYTVGGGSYQTNRANHLLVWSYGTNLLVTPLTTTAPE